MLWTNEAIRNEVSEVMKLHGRLSKSDTISLCQRIRDDLTPTYPEPDWSQAPDWARWWAVDADGSAGWFEKEPTYEGPKNPAVGDGEHLVWDIPDEFPHAKYLMGMAIDFPLGCDWRLTKRQRPEAT